MNIIDKKIKELITILEKENWKAIDFETVGAVTIKFALHKPKYRYLISQILSQCTIRQKITVSI